MVLLMPDACVVLDLAFELFDKPSDSLLGASHCWELEALFSELRY
jgi:hypothetical protein